MEQFPHTPLNTLCAEDFLSQRTGARDSLLLVAQLRVAGEPEVQVRVRNLSTGGLMAEHAEPIAAGTKVSVEVRGVGWVTGKTAWWAEGRVGIAFDRAIDPLRARKPVGQGRTPREPGKPALGRR